MNTNKKLILFSLLAISSLSKLFGSSAESTPDQPLLRTIPIIEVAGDKMPGWEKQIIELYQDEERNPMPVVFRGAAKNWEAASWTPEWFTEQFGDKEIAVMHQNLKKSFRKTSENTAVQIIRIGTTIKDHITDILLNPENAGYLICSSPYNITKDQLDKFDFDNEFIKNLIFAYDHLQLSTQTQFPQSIIDPQNAKNKPHVYALLIGSENSLANLHSHASNFLAQIYGKKMANLVHPKYVEKCSCMLANDQSGLTYKCPTDLAEPDFENYPGLKDIEVYQTILEPGDVLYIPNEWLHEIRGLSTSISIASGF